MKKAVKRIVSMLLAIMLVAGMAVMQNVQEASAANERNYRELKSGGKLTTNITPSKISETYYFYLSNPAKVTFQFTTDLSSGANINIKKGIEFVSVGSKISVKNAEKKTVTEYLSAGDYYVTVARDGMNESGKITTSCTVKLLDQKNDKLYNDTLAQATDFTEFTQANFKGSFLYDDHQDTFKITFQDAAKLQFKLESLTDNGGMIKVEVGTLDPSGDLVPSYTGICSKTAATQSSVIDFNQNVSAGTYYIRLTSETPGEYRFSSQNITAPINKLVVKKKVTLKVGKTTSLIKAIKPSGATGTIRVKIADDSKVELLNTKKGKIQALKVGKTTVTFTISSTGKRYTSTVTVKK